MNNSGDKQTNITCADMSNCKLRIHTVSFPDYMYAYYSKL